MPEILEYNESSRQELRLQGRRSLYFFGTTILGYTAYSPTLGRSILAPVHRDLAHFLEARPPFKPWQQALVAAARGIGKSIWTDICYPCWRTIHIPNRTFKLVENSYENAKINHFIPLISLFTESPRSDFLQWLYQEEIPDGFKGWNSQHLYWKQTNPEAGPSLSYWGMNARWEGTHPCDIGLDDLEGAEAEKSSVSSTDAYSAYEQANPLLADQSTGQILITGTPHGEEPFVWRIRESGLMDAIFWRPLLDEDEKYESCIWQEKFPELAVNRLKKLDIWDQQYMLRKRSRKVSFFDMGVIRDNFYERLPHDPLWIKYKSSALDPNNVNKFGNVHPETVDVTVSLRQLRYFLHYDPSHRKDQFSQRKQFKVGEPQKFASMAISAVGIAPDMHGFLIDYKKKPGLELHQQAEDLLMFYCMFAPWLVTSESIGAQQWFRSFVESMEKASPYWRYPKTIGPIFGESPFDLPPMSTRIIASDKPSDKDKVMLICERLSAWFNKGLFHLHESQSAVLYELEHIEDDTLDLLDSIAHGPGRIPAEQNDGNRTRPDAGQMVWSAPLPREYTDQLRARQKASEFLRDPKTGWAPFWNQVGDTLTGIFGRR